MKYSYENLSLETMEGERWSEIPGYEGCYVASNLGRIQSLPRQYERLMGNKGYITYTSKPRIRKQLAQAEYNAQTDDYNITLVLSLCKEGISKKHVVSRLVYAAFAGPIDFQQDSLSVLHHNGDTRDNRLSNLYLATMSERSVDGRRRGRQQHNLSDYLTPELIAARGQKRHITVSQYSLSGQLIKVYPSLKDAEAETGVYHSRISNVIKGKWVSSGGFIWRKGAGEPFISTAEALAQRWGGKRGLTKREALLIDSSKVDR
jgi:hypothetical protein